MTKKDRFFKTRMLLAILTIIFILIPVIVNSTAPKIDIKDIDQKVEAYGSMYKVTIILEFKQKPTNGTAAFRFYNNKSMLITIETVSFTPVGYSAIGEVMTTEYVSRVAVEDHSFKAYNVSWMAIFAVISIYLLIWSLFLSCKKYEVGDQQIVVYAGFYHRRLYVGTKLCDEHRTLGTFVPIKLSTVLEDGTEIDVKISLLNRIALKADNVLVQPVGKQLNVPKVVQSYMSVSRRSSAKLTKSTPTPEDSTATNTAITPSNECIDSDTQNAERKITTIEIHRKEE
ncbi:MAG: hypothetical protein IKC29_03880 [Clostridia bacterium]|nr:hypothetical protein [Clostridia bacterium]